MSLAVVQNIVRELREQGVSLAGDEGQFAVTSRVAWALRGQGVGLRKKPDGTNFHGFSVDVVLDSTDWKEYDVLVNGGLEDAGPAYNFTGCIRNASYFYEAFDPASGAIPINTEHGTGGTCSGGSGSSGSGGAPGGVAIGYLPRQCGLLEDEIMYRLTLLTEHVFVPIKARFPNVRIIEGFRYENTSKNQHERGEALDLVFDGYSNDQTYAALKWIRDNVAYDQLIWCHSNLTAQNSWVHISFVPTGRRRQVLTKDFADVFHDGLHLYINYTDSVQRNKDLAEYQTNKTYAEQFVQMQTARENRLNPVGVNTPVNALGSAGAGENCTRQDAAGQPVVYKQQFGGYAGEIFTVAERIKIEHPEYWEAQLSGDGRNDLRFIEALRAGLSFRAYLSGSGGGTSTNWSNDQLLVPGNPTASPNSKSPAPEDCLELYDCIQNAGIESAKIGWAWHGEDNCNPLNPKDWVS